MEKSKGLQGIIVKGYSGFYYVWDGKSLWECSLRGRFRVKKQDFLPGDQVIITVLDEVKKKAVIEEIRPRQNQLIRPSVANVEQVIIVMALANPETDWWLLDRLLIMALTNGVQPLMCFNKADLCEEEVRAQVVAAYRKTGFPLLVTSVKKGWGIQELKSMLANRTSVFAGPSGVGKSSLLNALEPGLSLKTGEVSVRMERGKHTTRHVELICLREGGLIADTPGFSQVYLPAGLKRESLVEYYPDFEQYQALCRFKTCLHRDEPECAVREAVFRGDLDRPRYERYLQILEEIIAQERRY